MTHKYTFLATALAAFALSTSATELPESYRVVHTDVQLSYNASSNTITLKLTPADYVTTSTGNFTIETVDKIEIQRGGKDANGDYHNSSTIIKTLENVPAGRTTVYMDSDVLPGERYVYYVKTYVGEDYDWPDMNEFFTYVKPAAITDLSAAASDDKGNLPVILSGTVPSKTETGSNLGATDLQAIVLLRGPYEFNHTGDIQEIGRIENPTPGASFSWTDNTAELNKAYSYAAYALTEGGQSETNYILFRTGQDIPTAPTNLAVTGDLTSLTLSWDAVTTGENEGYINPEDITYSLYEFKTDCYPDPDTEVLLKAGITGTTYTADFSDLSEPKAVTLRLRAVSPAGESDYTAFKKQIVGNPASLPWLETFNKTNNQWGGITSDHAWDITAYAGIGSPELYLTKYGFYYTDPFSNSGETDFTGIEGNWADDELEGMLFAFYDKPAVDVAVTEPINFSRTKNPVLTLNVYQLPAEVGSTNYVEVFAGKDEYTSCGKANCFGEQEGWTKNYITLTGIAGTEYARIKLHSVALEFPAPVSIDHVAIDDFPAVDDLTYTLEDGKCSLSWSNPSTDTQEVTAYKVVVNDQVEETQDTWYTFEMPESGEAQVQVAAIYGDYTAPAQTLTIKTDGISTLTDAEGNSVVYTNLAGVSVQRPEKGVYIKTTIKADGTRKTEKITY